MRMDNNKKTRVTTNNKLLLLKKTRRAQTLQRYIPFFGHILVKLHVVSDSSLCIQEKSPMVPTYSFICASAT
jgi:hypothetical protein